MVNRFALIVPAALLLGSLTSARAQSPLWTLPKPLHNAWGTGALNITTQTSWSGQAWFRGDNLPQGGYLISAIGKRGNRGHSSAAYTANLQIRMENTAVTFPLSRTLADNITDAATVVFTNKQINVPARGPGMDPLVPYDGWRVLDVPFLFTGTGPHFIMQRDFDTWVSTGTNWWDAVNQSGRTELHSIVGKTCGGSLFANSFPGNYTLTVTRVPPNSLVTLLFGFDNIVSGSLYFPLDLGYLGMTGCELSMMPVASQTIQSGPTGTGRIIIPYTLPTDSRILYVQALHPTNTNPAGWATTNGISSIFGNVGAFSGIFSLNGVTAEPGWPRPQNAVIISLLR